MAAYPNALEVAGPDRWRKSSHSGGNGACIEVAELDVTDVAIRDSKVPTGPAFTASRTAFAAFTAYAKTAA